jgi:uncharacterized membrane protein YgcG
MSDNNFNRTPRVKNALDNQKLKLQAKNEQGKNANLSWNLFSNNPRVTVWTGVDGDKDNGKITGAFDTLGFYQFLEGLKMAIAFVPTEGAKEFRQKVELMRPNFKPGGGRPDGVVKASEVWYGKDAEGVVWLSLCAYQRPMIKFVLIPNEYHQFRHATGEALSAGEASTKLAAPGYIRALELIMAQLQVVEYKEPPPRDQGGNRGGQGGGGYGGGNRGGGQGGGGNYDRRNTGGGGGGDTGTTGDDDLPF